MQRSIAFLLVVVAAVCLFALNEAGQVRLLPTRIYSGWGLMALVLGLALLGARKRLPFIPLGNATAWLRVHVYAGWLVLFVFSLHIDFSLPNGVLETTLALLFSIVALSGVIGIGISRTFPTRLAARGESVLFERIPELRAALAREIEELILKTAAEAKGTTLTAFYSDRLVPFFQAPRHVLYHLVDSDLPVRRLLRELDDLQRYTSAKEKDLSVELGRRVRTKNDLDYQYAHQSMLKLWLLVHVPTTFSLIVLGLAHAVFALSFGGAR